LPHKVAPRICNAGTSALKAGGSHIETACAANDPGEHPAITNAYTVQDI